MDKKLIRDRFSFLIEQETPPKCTIPIFPRYVKYKNTFGIIQLWAWNNSYLFFDFKSGKEISIPIDEINERTKDVTGIEFHKFFTNHYLPNSSKEAQDISNKFNYSVNNLVWTGDFCRGVAFLLTALQFHNEVIEKYGSFSISKKLPTLNKFPLRITPLDSLVDKYYKNKDSVYNLTCEKIGFHGYNRMIGEEDVISCLREIKKLPEDSKKDILNSDVLKCKEFKYYDELSN